MAEPEVLIEARGVRKHFRGAEAPALDGVDIIVEAGRICALLGTNGAGKTTMIRILTTLLTPDEGQVKVAGYDIATHPGQVRASIGLVGQYAALDEILTGRQNLELFSKLAGMRRAEARRHAARLLETAGLGEVGDRVVSKLSGGLRRRMDLATSLITTPRVLFVDEPTTGVDPHARRDLWARLREMADQGVAILLTTQYLEEADALADDVVILKAGSVIARGTTADLKQLVGEPKWELREPTLEDVYLHLHATSEEVISR
ncbi:ABC transporter ATP-binding protein [Kineosporia babensis]|uniref:ATP-binding cassette domain-containing protein n=1 Tax=Kineosporia babensis TaxID=499548 RepID=A0A9X1NAI8_9ACTN|nr:ATP-binding cassette domain-containing protein [Kineosporia babensis]MCD5310189.1 ATP-binding cassette domain-containing protein [Kineosporia babensis]